MRLIYAPTAAFGGHEFEARADRGGVHIYHRAPGGARFTRGASITQRFFDDWRQSLGSDHDNPAHISRLVDSFERDE